MSVEITYPNDFRSLSPSRDIKHILVPVISAALTTTSNVYPEDSDKYKEVIKLSSLLSGFINDAKIKKDTVINILSFFKNDLINIDKDVIALFHEHMAINIYTRYIAGLRESETMEVLLEDDITFGLTTMNTALNLPIKERNTYIQKNRYAGGWKGMDAINKFKIAKSNALENQNKD